MRSNHPICEACLRPLPEDHLTWTVESLRFPVRVKNCFQRAQPSIVTMADLLGKSKAELLTLKEFGLRSLVDVISLLAEYGLVLRDFPEGFSKDWREEGDLLERTRDAEK